MNLNILFFGPLADMIGREIAVDLPEGVTDIQGLRAHLAFEFPDAAEHLTSPRTKCLIGDCVVMDSAALLPGSIVEFFPPVSGG